MVAALGDSITAGAPLWDPDKATRDSLGEGVADEKSQYEYWAEQRLGDASFKNCGVSGERTDEIAVRFDECAEGVEVLIVQGGANDINQGKSPESAAKNLRSMIKRGKERGLRVATTELVPWPGGDPDQTPQGATAQRADRPDRRGGGRPGLRLERGARGSGQPGQARPEYDRRRPDPPDGRGLQAHRGGKSSCRRVDQHGLPRAHASLPSPPPLRSPSRCLPAAPPTMPSRSSDDAQKLQNDAQKTGDSCARRPRTSRRRASRARIPTKEAEDLQKKGQKKSQDLQKKGQQIEKDAREQAPGY